MFGILCVSCARWVRERDKETDWSGVTIVSLKLATSLNFPLPKNCTLVHPLWSCAKITLSLAKNVALFKTVLTLRKIHGREKGQGRQTVEGQGCCTGVAGGQYNNSVTGPGRCLNVHGEQTPATRSVLPPFPSERLIEASNLNFKPRDPTKTLLQGKWATLWAHFHCLCLFSQKDAFS